MPRYFFHRIADGQDLDLEGIELPDLDAARREAVLFASDTLKEKKYELWQGGEIRIEVREISDKLVFVLSVAAINL